MDRFECREPAQHLQIDRERLRKARRTPEKVQTIARDDLAQFERLRVDDHRLGAIAVGISSRFDRKLDRIADAAGAARAEIIFGRDTDRADRRDVRGGRGLR